MKRILSILLSLIMLILYIFTIPAFALDRQSKIISGGAREATEEQMAGVEEKVHLAQQTRSIYIYESERLGFSVTISGIGQDEIIAEETDTCVNFTMFHPARNTAERLAPLKLFPHGLISSPGTTMIWHTKSSQWGRTRCFYGGTREEALTPAGNF